MLCSIRTCKTLWSFSVNFRHLSSQIDSTPKKLIFKEFGNPLDVLEMVDDDKVELTSDLGEHEVLLKVLASPINPADINYIQGVYALKPTNWPAPAGNEGVMKVLQTGSKVSHLSPGNHVVPKPFGIGMWRTHMRLPADQVSKVSEKLPIDAAATMRVNPCTAYRLISDFADLEEGDWIIQNGATSGVGLFVSQMARNRGIRTLSIIRRRSNDEVTKEIKTKLMEFGADVVLTEDEVKKRRDVKAKLALNCVGGKSALSLFPFLTPGSAMVTYGAMSRSPIPVPASPLIFKDIALRGFWITAWSEKVENSERHREMLNAITQNFISGHLRLPPLTEVPFEDYLSAVKANELGVSEPQLHLPIKQVLVMR